MRYLEPYKIFKIFESISDIEADIRDILTPITDYGTTLYISSYIRSRSISSSTDVIEIRLTNYHQKVKPVDNKEDFERLKEYLGTKGYRFEKWWITHGHDKSWNNLFKSKRDDMWDDMRYPVKEEWVELYFIK